MKDIDLFIETDDPAQTVLRQSYITVRDAFAQAKDQLAAYRKANNEKVHRPHTQEGKEMDRYNARKRICAVAYLRLRLAMRALHPLLQPLMDVTNKLRQEREDKLRGERDSCYGETAIEMNNLATCEELYDEGCAIYFEYAGLYPDSMDNDAIENAYKKRPSLERHFVTKSSGHGSAYRFDGGDGSTVPPPPYMTTAEAENSVKDWECYADTIGGAGEVCDVNKHLEYVARMEAWRSKEPDADQAELIAQNLERALKEIAAANPPQEYDRDWGMTFRLQNYIKKDEDLVIIFGIAKGIVEQGFEVRDFFTHSRKEELWVSMKKPATQA